MIFNVTRLDNFVETYLCVVCTLETRHTLESLSSGISVDVGWLPAPDVVLGRRIIIIVQHVDANYADAQSRKPVRNDGNTTFTRASSDKLHPTIARLLQPLR